jgi:hypothetical protein
MFYEHKYKYVTPVRMHVLGNTYTISSIMISELGPTIIYTPIPVAARSKA